MWFRLSRGFRGYLIELSFELNSSDKAYVVDRSHYADYQFRVTNNEEAALRKYAHSRVDSKKYSNNFKMPELIMGNPVSIDRVISRNVFRVERVTKSGEFVHENMPIEMIDRSFIYN